MIRRLLVATLVALCASSGDPMQQSVAPVTREPQAPQDLHAATARMVRLPLRFEPNVGQWDPRVRFVARQGGAALFITDEGMTLGLHDKVSPRSPCERREEQQGPQQKAFEESKAAAVTIKLVGSKPSVPRGEKQLVTRSNFFLGNDPTKWRRNVPNYAQVRVKAWVSGVDVVWHGGEGGLEYDLEVVAGVDARNIAFELGGAKALRVDANGALEIATAAGTLLQKSPRVVQNGRELAVRYRVNGNHVGLALDAYDPSSAVLIDPGLAYSTYLGLGDSGSNSPIVVDSSGNAYVIGSASATNFPTTAGAYQTSNKGSINTFVTKLNASGSALVYSTYLGGNGVDYGNGIAVDSSGNAYVVGDTSSTNFPTTVGAYQTSNKGQNAFVTKLDASGSALAYSTYLGGSTADWGEGIAFDTSGKAYVTGFTQSTNFPTTIGAYQTSNRSTVSGSNAFVAQLNASGSALIYSTYVGGSSYDSGSAIAIDSSGNVYVAGQTTSADFPTTTGAFQTFFGGGIQPDAFVIKLNALGSTLTYSTYVGGSEGDYGQAIAINSSGNAYVTGSTTSTNFPVTTGAYQTSYGGGNTDSFVTKLNGSGSGLVYSTYLGGSLADASLGGIAVDSSGNTYVTGQTASTNFPTTDAYQTAYAGGAYDAYVTEVNALGSALVYSTYLGGSGDDGAAGVALDSLDNMYVSGYTASTDFPVTVGAYQTSNVGSDDFIAKITDPTTCLQADGVCCDSACTGQCEACDVVNHVGTCTPVTGAPHGTRMSCGGTGPCAPTCDGTTIASCAYPGAVMVCASSCAAGTETESTCDGAGNCIASAPQSCKNLMCSNEGAGGTCKTSCTTNADCLPNYGCAADGTCQPVATCVNDHTSQGASGPPQDCTPFKCGTSGACEDKCVSVNDCVTPNLCGPMGTCTAPSSSSGGCNTVDASPSYPVFLAVAIATLLARKQRRT